jgi:hypothetical protein
MKAEHSPPPRSARYIELNEILHDVEFKYTPSEFQAALDYIEKAKKGESPRTAGQQSIADDPIVIGGDESSGLIGDEADRLVEEAKKAFFEKKLLLVRLKAEKLDLEATRRYLLLQRRPGKKFTNLATVVLGEKRFERYVAPALADMHLEYFDAIKAGELKKAKIIVWRFYACTLWPVLKIFFATIKTLFEFANR